MRAAAHVAHIQSYIDLPDRANGLLRGPGSILKHRLCQASSQSEQSKRTHKPLTAWWQTAASREDCAYAL